MNSETNTRSRKYILTINNPEEHQVTVDSIKDAIEKYNLIYYAMCAETGSQGTYHYHVYVYFRNAILFSTLKGLFPTANIQTVKGTSLQVKAYIMKSLPEYNKKDDGSYEYKDKSGKIHKGINHSETFIEFGECPKEEQGKRSDLEQMYEYVKIGYTNSKIIELCGDTAIKYHDKINKLRYDYFTDIYRRERRLNLKVNYITGKTGCGKTRDILDEYGDEQCYRVTDYKHPFDSYDSLSPVMIFEEFRSSLEIEDMLKYLDIYPLSLPARYAPKVMAATTIFVVSNWEFEQQYDNLPNNSKQITTYEAWLRRFNGYVKEYYDVGKFNYYETLNDYLHRFKSIGKDVQTPFDTDENETMPFD
jgi:hypothetical protein